VQEVLETGGKPVTRGSMDRVLARWGFSALRDTHTLWHPLVCVTPYDC
jgi:hypothetical protein